MTIPNILVSVAAPRKAGKTHFSLTFPAPIYVMSFDIGTQFVVDKFPDKEIVIAQYPTALLAEVSGLVDSCLQSYVQIAADFNKAVGGNYKTIVIDTGTALWEIVRIAFAEEREEEGKPLNPKKGALEYAQPNRRMAAFFAKAQLTGVNLVVNSHLKEQWAGGQPTGELVLSGFGQTEAYSDVCLSMEMKGTKQEVKTISTIIDCRFARELRGETLVDATYNDIIALMEM